MKPKPAALKRSRRALFYAALIACVVAMLAGGLVAAPAGPARADQAVSTGGPYAITNPGGDMVATYDAAGVNPAIASDFLTTTWPQGVGLSAGASLSSLFQATWKANSALNVSQSEFPDPPAFSGGSATVASDGSGGSVITFDIPAADFQNTSSPFWNGVAAQISGAIAAVVGAGLCGGLILAIGAGALVTGPPGALVLSAVAKAICGGVGAASWTFVATLVGAHLAGTPLNRDFWSGIAGATLAAFVGGAVIGAVLTPVVEKVFTVVLKGVGNALVSITKFLQSWLGKGYAAFIASVQRFWGWVTQLFRSLWPGAATRAGAVPPAAGGRFELLPVPDTGAPFAVPLCLDAYGASGGEASPGQVVAVNSCNGTENQEFDYYSDGMVSDYGMCLSPGGGTSSLGTPLLTLEPCTGATNQQWIQSGAALVNQGGGGCLDDPNLNTTPGTQLDLYPCNGSAAQNWQKPAPEPCDIYGAGGTGCVAAYSTTRALYADYGGPLYQVKRASDGTTANVGLLQGGGDVNAAAQDSFCTGTTCVITEIYDQSPLGNNLTIEGAGGAGGADVGANATALPITVGGNKAYGVDIEAGTGYRDDATLGVATNGEPEGMYMVASGTHVNSGCCFDFGNVEANNHDNGDARMDAVNLSTTCFNGGTCSGNGPWVQADLENGLFMGSTYTNTANKGNSTPFVTAMLSNTGQSTFALSGGDSTSGGLSQWYDGALPSGYAPMKQEGGIVLGTGGDNSNSSIGSWFEGVMTAGAPSQATNSAVQANIVAAKYTGTTNPAGGSGGSGASGAAPSAAGQAVVHTAGATGAAASGYSSVYTVDSANGHLQETYLPSMGAAWVSQDLTVKYGTPAVMPGTEPVALVHCGYTSVYTVDAANGDLQETYLPAIGGPWTTQDLSAKYGTPPTSQTPTAVVHSAGATGSAAACGFTSVYTVNRNGDLQETYLTVLGASWVTQDLSKNYGTPALLAGTSPVALVHCGYTSVYTVDGNDQVQETYLPAIGRPWTTQNLSVNYGTPTTTVTPTAVVHSAGATGSAAACGFTSVYTIDQANQHLQETYLTVLGAAWTTQDLSANYGTPAVAPGTAPVALVHVNYTSVYTVNQGSGDLQETYLPAIGAAWHSQNLTTTYGTPQTDQTPVVLLHPDTSGNLDWTSVYTVDEFNAHLQETYLPNTGFPGDPWVTQDLTAKYGAPPVYVQQGAAAGWSVVHDGYTSAYTVNASNGDLNESYLPAMGQSWVSQDLSANYHAPAVKEGTVPVALYHDGYTSVYTVDAASRDLQETYLPGAAQTGVGWNTQDLTAQVNTPPVAVGSSPAAAFHDGYVSVYTVGSVSGALEETYLPAAGFPGDPWQTQSLSAKYGTPAVMTGTSPVAVVHDGYVSVYTIDAGDSTHAQGDLQETFLPFIGAGWLTQDLSTEFGTPPSHVTPAAVFHDGYTSVYTVGSQGDLQETFLPALGGGWLTQDLTAGSGVPKALNVAPTALYHDGYTSVYYLSNPGDHLTEASLSAINGQPWHWQDMSANYGVPASVRSPSALVHYNTSGALTWASVYTTDASTGDLRETYLPDTGFPGDGWLTQDLSANYHTPAGEQGGGSVLYAQSSASEGLGYDRMIRLANAGSANGTLLATFEHGNGNGTVTNYVIQKSTDDGATWSTLSTVPGDAGSLAPFLFEYPKQLGSYPAGTLMLLGNTVNASNTGAAIREWLSTDHGAHWTYIGVVQSSSGGAGDGVWEPFVMVDKAGDLALFFSDERQHATYSQFLGELVSGDGGNTWGTGPGEIKVVASSFPADRPGMATVAPIGSGAGGYALSYEMCGPQACSVHVKMSPDGTTWASDPAGTPSGPVTLGTVAQTSDGLFLQGTPVITSVNNGGPVGSTLYLSGRFEASASGTVPPNQNIILTNTEGGTGPWSWTPAPAVPTAGAPAACNTKYSPYLLRSADNSQLLYTVAAAAGPYNCEEITARVTIQS